MLSCKKPKLFDNIDNINSITNKNDVSLNKYLVNNELEFKNTLKQQIFELLLLGHIICVNSDNQKTFIVNDNRKNKVEINIYKNSELDYANNKLKDIIKNEKIKESKFIFKIVDSWKTSENCDEYNYSFYMWLQNITLLQFTLIIENCDIMTMF